MNHSARKIKTWILATSLGLSGAVSAQAQSSTLTRTSSFEYVEAGLLIREVIEPDRRQACLQTTHGYNAKGNPTVKNSSACAGGRQVSE